MSTEVVETGHAIAENGMRFSSCRTKSIHASSKKSVSERNAVAEFMMLVLAL
ncbi:MAG: hypothetical protein KBT28_01225 [Bacteroidales bacterium]|nr:hypothetical protein [Candidatus Colimorpha merdihippi]